LSKFLLLSAVVHIMAGCMATAPTAGAPDGKATAEAYEQYLTDAEQKLKAGQRESAVTALSEAAKIAPTRKEPWLRMAQIHFDSNNHGQAITAAQEVLSRDPADKSARSILAVSGLRVSVKALSELRASNGLSGDARTEAESLARTLRDSLGATVLVPTPANPVSRPGVANEQRPASTGSSAGSSVSTSAPAASSGSTPAPARSGAPAAPARSRGAGGSSPSSPSGGNNPFGSLK